MRHCGWYPDYRQPQFFNKKKMKYREQLVHETFDLDGKLGYLKGHCLQYPFTSLSQFFNKMENYSTLRAREMLQAGRSFSVFQLITHPAAMFNPSAYNPAQKESLITPTLSGGKRMGIDPKTGTIYPAVAIGLVAPGSGNPPKVTTPR